MIVVAETYARYASTVAESELRVAGENLLKLAENAAHQVYAQRFDELGIAVTVRVEIGSTRIWITVRAFGKAFLLYAAIRQGVDYLIKDSEKFAKLVVPHIPAELRIPFEHPQYHARRLGLPGQLRVLFEKVERGELSPEEATTRAVLLFQRQDKNMAQEVQAFEERLSSELSFLGSVTLKMPEFEQSYRASEASEHRSIPSGTPSLPWHPDPVIARVPGTASRRRRRTGIVATRDPETANVHFIQY